MRRYLVRVVKHNKKGHRIGKFREVYANSMKEAVLKDLITHKRKKKR